MVIYSRLFIICFLILSSAVCASATVPPSSINVSVTASSTDLAVIINRSVPNELYKGQAGPGTSVTVIRSGPVAVTAADNFVYLALPVQLTFRYARFESNPIRIGLRFKARVNVAPDWRLRTELYYTGLSDKLADRFKIGPLSFNPRNLVENLTQPVQKLLAPIIDKEVNNSIQLRSKIAPLWQNAFSPLLVNKEFSTWLKLTPEKIVMTPLQTSNDQIRLSIGVITGAEITVGPRPVPAPVRPLPPVEQARAFDKSFRIQLASEIFFSDLVTALNPVLLDKTFGDDKKITIRKFNLKEEDGRLVIVMTTSGDFDGELTLFAKPVYDRENNALVFENIDFDTRNTGWLMNAGSWLFSSIIRITIKSKLDSAAIEQLEKARLKASLALSSVQLGEHLKLTGSVNSLSLGEASVLNDRLSVNVIARGESSVSLK